MGTPDILGTYGTFSFFTSAPTCVRGRTRCPAARSTPWTCGDGVVRAAARRARQSVSARTGRRSTAPFTRLRRSRRSQFVKLVVGDEERLLRVGEWSDWVPVEFPLAPPQTLRGECRFYLKQLDPPSSSTSARSISIRWRRRCRSRTPASYAAELAHATGRFYTQGMPEDTKAPQDRRADRRRVPAQARLARRRESSGSTGHVLDGFDDGSAVLLLRQRRSGVAHDVAARDPEHPAYDAADRRAVRDGHRGSLRGPRSASSATRSRGSARTTCSS